MYWKKMVLTLPMKIWTHCKFTSCFVPTGELRLWGRQWGPQLRRDSCLQARECEQCLLWERQPDAWEKTSAIGRRLRVKGHEIEKQSQKSEESNHLQGWFPHKSHQVLMEKHRKCFSNTSLVRHTWGKRISNHGGAKIPSGNFLPLQLSKWKHSSSKRWETNPTSLGYKRKPTAAMKTEVELNNQQPSPCPPPPPRGTGKGWNQGGHTPNSQGHSLHSTVRPNANIAQVTTERVLWWLLVVKNLT